MGIDCAFALQLLEAVPLVQGRSAGLMLGRQGLAVRQGHRKYLRRALAARDLSRNYPDYLQEDGFAETFLQKIGYPEMQAMDASAYENCAITHDLNDPLPQHLRGRFDVVIDGGTLEHVFNTPQALDNVFHLLREGGIFLSINGMSGWAGHGFYQFSPELVWRYWQDARGCEVLACRAVSIDPAEPPVEVMDTGKQGARFRARKLEGRWYLYHAIRKPGTANAAERIAKTAQGDYALRWERGAAE
ncbi:hypothetical protein ACFSUD_10695 [Sulfitobacter aestuarii]|uniref:Methyltransferase domain-containing protein n=1 Tax=Sulfitobacter aestuarii TaxID=2161676 RepID=A0ABW5U300_9RHOB